MKIIALVFLFGVFQFSNGNPTNDDRIVNGEDAEQGQFPHQVLWTYDGRVMCGGSIYNKSTIITAAHCCYLFEDDPAYWQLELTNIIAGRIDVETGAIGTSPTMTRPFVDKFVNEVFD